MKRTVFVRTFCEALLEAIAVPDVGELVQAVGDDEVRRLFSSLLARLVELRDSEVQT